MYTFNPDLLWPYIVIQEQVTVYPYSAALDALDASAAFTCDSYNYDDTLTDVEEDDSKEERGFVLRMSQVPDKSLIVPGTVIYQVENQIAWRIAGEIKFLTKQSRVTCTAVKLGVFSPPVEGQLQWAGNLLTWGNNTPIWQ